jgi:hypothetical protein
LSLQLAARLLRAERSEASRMPTVNNKKIKPEDRSSQPSDLPDAIHEDSRPEAERKVIELGDLTSGPDSEVNEIKAAMNNMSAAIDLIRNENVKLSSDYQKLSTELREIKLVLAKVHAKELQTIERRRFWFG